MSSLSEWVSTAVCLVWQHVSQGRERKKRETRTDGVIEDRGGRLLFEEVRGSLSIWQRVKDDIPTHTGLMIKRSDRLISSQHHFFLFFFFFNTMWILKLYQLRCVLKPESCLCPSHTDLYEIWPTALEDAGSDWDQRKASVGQWGDGLPPTYHWVPFNKGTIYPCTFNVLTYWHTIYIEWVTHLKMIWYLELKHMGTVKICEGAAFGNNNGASSCDI